MSDTKRESIVLLLKARFDHMDEAVPWSRTDFLYRHGNPIDALLYAALFVPEFIEVEGFVFLEGLGPEASGGWEEVARKLRQDWTSTPEDLQCFINSFNWVEIPYLFAAEGNGAEYEALVTVLIKAWQARLLMQFPQRSFIVQVIPPSETGSVIGLGFKELKTG